VVVGQQGQRGEYALDFSAAQTHVAADGRRVEAASVQGKLYVRNPDTGDLEAVSPAAAREKLGLRGLDGGGRTAGAYTLSAQRKCFL